MTGQLNTRYDKHADVLYLTVGDPTQIARYREDVEYEGVIWRFNAEDRVFGVTITDFRDYWLARRETLLKQVCVRLPASQAALEAAIRD